MPRPIKIPMMGRIVTHFSFGSFLSSHGFSTSPFLILREWKYLWLRVSRERPSALELPKLDAGLEIVCGLETVGD